MFDDFYKEGRPLMTARSDNRVWGWDRQLSSMLFALCVTGCTFAAGCQGGGGPVGGANEDSRADTGAEGPVDAAASMCRGIAKADECRARGSCQWLTVTCDGGGIAAGCYPEEGWLEAVPACGVSGDIGAASGDVATSCSEVAGEQQCRSRENCEWWTDGCGEATCLDLEDVSDDSGCADSSSSADTGAAADASYEDTGQRSDDDTDGDAGTSGSASDGGSMACRSYSDESACGSASHCKWWVDSCDGAVVEKRCVSQTDSPEPSECQRIPPNKCHEREDESSCPAPNCAWVEQGCGSGPTGTGSLSDCLPSTDCTSDTDCPASHACTTLWIDPCHDGNCLACGREAKRCVPRPF